MNKIITAFALCALTCSGFAAETKDQLAGKLLDVSDAKKRNDEQIANLTKFAAMQAQMYPNAPEAMKEKHAKATRRIEAFLQSEMSWEKVKPKMVSLYAENYTEAEMKAAIAFYESDAGHSFGNKMLTVMEKGMRRSMKELDELRPEIQQIAAEELSGAAPKPRSELRANAVEKCIINDARQVASAAQQIMAENAVSKVTVGAIRKSGFIFALSAGVKIGEFNPAKPGEVKLLDYASGEADAIALTYEGSFTLGHDRFDASTSTKLKDNASTVKGTAAFKVENGQPLTK